VHPLLNRLPDLPLRQRRAQHHRVDPFLDTHLAEHLHPPPYGSVRRNITELTPSLTPPLLNPFMKNVEYISTKSSAASPPPRSSPSTAMM